MLKKEEEYSDTEQSGLDCEDDEMEEENGS